MLKEQVLERIHMPVAGRVAGNVVRDVKLIGFESRNGRSYPPETLRAAVGHYEGVRVNVDHPDKPAAGRSIRDRIGVIKNARFVSGSGIHGDFHINPKHELAEQVLWDAEHNTRAVGFSHNASLNLKRSSGKSVVEQIVAVRHVDLVADPATTFGLFESVQESTRVPTTPAELMESLRGKKASRLSSGDFIKRLRR